MYNVIFQNEHGLTRLLHSGISTKKEALRLAYDKCKDKYGLQHYSDGYFTTFTVRGMLHILNKWYVEQVEE